MGVIAKSDNTQGEAESFFFYGTALEAGQYLVHIVLYQAGCRMVLPINEVALCLKGHLQGINPFPMAQGLQQTIRQHCYSR